MEAVDPVHDPLPQFGMGRDQFLVQKAPQIVAKHHQYCRKPLGRIQPVDTASGGLIRVPFFYTVHVPLHTGDPFKPGSLCPRSAQSLAANTSYVPFSVPVSSVTSRTMELRSSPLSSIVQPSSNTTSLAE